MEKDTAWICIAAIAIVGIISLALIFKNNNTYQTNAPEQGMTYVYDDKDRLQSIIPMNSAPLKLKPM